MREFLPADLRDDVRFLAERRGTSQAQVIRDAVALYMKGTPINPVSIAGRPKQPVELRIKLKAVRGERHISLRQLGELIGIRPDELSRFETGKLNLTDEQCAEVERWIYPLVQT